MLNKYKILNSNIQANTHEFLINSVDDLEQLPKEVGSIALIANSSDVYICNNKKEWKKI